MIDALKKTRPLGQVKCEVLSDAQTFDMEPKAQFMTATWTRQDHTVAMVCDQNMVRGGIFM